MRDDAEKAEGAAESDAAFAYELADTKIPDTTDALIGSVLGNG